MSELMAHAWIAGKDTIGVVIVRDSITEKYKGYIGVVSGVNEEADLEWVRTYGTKLSLNSAVALIADCGQWYAGEPPPDLWGASVLTGSDPIKQ